MKVKYKGIDVTEFKTPFGIMQVCKYEPLCTDIQDYMGNIEIMRGPTILGYCFKNSSCVGTIDIELHSSDVEIMMVEREEQE